MAKGVRSEGAGQSALTKQRVFFVLALTIGVTLLSQLERQTLAALAPTITRELHFSEVQYGMLAAAFSIAHVISAPLAARILDNIGARVGLFAAVIMWTVVAGLHALAPGFAALIVLRLALGVVEAPTLPGATQMLERILPPHKRARAVGFLFTGGSIGQALAAPLASIIAVTYGWRAGFLGTALLSLIWVPLWVRATRPIANQLDARPAQVQVGSKTNEAPALPMWSYRAFWRAGLLVIAFAPATSIIVLWGAKLLVRHYNLTQGQVGQYIWVPAVALDLGAVLFGDLVSRRRQARGGRAVSERWLVALAASFVTAIVAVPRAETVLHAVIWMAIVKIGAGGLLTLAISEHAPAVGPRRVSIIGGAVAAAHALMFTLTSLLTGKLVQSTKSYFLITQITSLWLVPLIWIWFATAPNESELVAEGPAPKTDESELQSA